MVSSIEEISNELIDEYVAESRVQRNLDDFFQNRSEINRPHLQTQIGKAESFGDIKTVCNLLSNRADNFLDERNVFILLGIDKTDEGHIAEIKAYSDGHTNVAKLSDKHFEHYTDIVAPDNPMEPHLQYFDQALPSPFEREDYKLDLGNPEYIKARDGGVIGPRTKEYHNRFNEFEQQQ